MTETITIADGLLGAERGAQYCDHGDRCHRYKLWRIWDPDVQPVLFVMLNPSVADERQLDSTVRRCVRYAQRWGYGGLYVGNLYGYRATNKDEMLAQPDPVGRDNEQALREMAALAGRVVVAWGSTREPVRGHRKRMVSVLRESGPGELYALALNGNGQPGHPLYLDKTLKPVLYEG